MIALTLTLAACVAAAPGWATAASTSPSGSLTVKKPRCSLKTTMAFTITSTPASNRFVTSIVAYTNGPPGKPGNRAIAIQTYVKVTRHAKATTASLPFGLARTIGIIAPVGEKVYIATVFGSSTKLTAGTATTVITLRKCPRPKFTG